MVHELPPDAAPATTGGNGEMMQVTTSTIVPPQDCAHNPAVGHGNEAHSRVALQIRLDILSRIGFAQANTLALMP